jgi:AcrR family transcriptional regulator
MPYTAAHKQQTRERIVRAARRLFNRRGFSDVSIDEIMAAAGLSRGGFYNHFKTKDELYAEAVTAISWDHPAKNWEGIELDFAGSGPKLARQIVEAYLSRQHFEDIDGSCPMIALPSDVARGGPQLKAAFRRLLEAMAGVFAASLPPYLQSAPDRALALASLLVGGMVLARAVDDEAFADRIRAAARELALEAGGWNGAGPQ